MHGYLSTGLCALQLPKKVVLSMARFRFCGHNLRIETGRHEGLPRNERSCRRCKRLLGEDFVEPIDDEEHLLFSCENHLAGAFLGVLDSLQVCETGGRAAWATRRRLALRHCCMYTAALPTTTTGVRSLDLLSTIDKLTGHFLPVSSCANIWCADLFSLHNARLGKPARSSIASVLRRRQGVWRRAPDEGGWARLPVRGWVSHAASVQDSDVILSVVWRALNDTATAYWHIWRPAVRGRKRWRVWGFPEALGYSCA
jgi:hypothetical protein